MMDSESENSRASGYLSSVLVAPRSRKPVIINTDNPLNQAEAWPAYHTGIDAKQQPAKGSSGVRTARLDALDSTSLVTSALTSVNRYLPSTHAARHAAKAAKKAFNDNANAKRRLSLVNPTPDLEQSPEQKDETISEQDKTTIDEGKITIEKDKKNAKKERSIVGPVAKKPRISRSSDAISPVKTAKTSATSTNESRKLLDIIKKNKRAPGMAVPKTLKQAGEADTMMWQWRQEGKNWDEIKEEWVRITGKEPGSSTLTTRYMKLYDNFMANGGADDMMLLKYRETVLQEMEGELWKRVAIKIGKDFGATFSADALRQRYNALKRNGYKVGEEFVEEGEPSDGSE